MTKKRNSYYFPHNFNSRHDPKCSALIRDFNYEGYGIYWALVEIMHEQGGKIEKFPKLYEGLAFQLGIPQEKLTKQIEALLQVLHLLQEDEKYIWSNRVLKNFEEREIKRLAKVEAGRLGGIASGKTRNEAKRSTASSTPKQTKQRKGKERKGKEIKKEKTNTIFLTKNQKILLQGKFPTLDISTEIEKANDFLKAEGLVKQDYFAWFRTWLRRGEGFLKDKEPEKVDYYSYKGKKFETEEELNKFLMKGSP